MRCSAQIEAEQGAQVLIEQYRRAQPTWLQEEVFTQRTRQADAERKLAVKPTKAAADSQRIANGKVGKIGKALAKLKNLDRMEARDSDFRMFPKRFVPVMTIEDGWQRRKQDKLAVWWPWATSFK